MLLLKGRRIVPVDEDGVRKPAFVEVPGMLDGGRVGGRVGEWDLVAAVVLEGDRAIGHD